MLSVSHAVCCVMEGRSTESIEAVNAKWLITYLLLILKCLSLSQTVLVFWAHRASDGDIVTNMQINVLKK